MTKTIKDIIAMQQCPFNKAMAAESATKGKTRTESGEYDGYPRGMKSECQAHYQQGFYDGALWAKYVGAQFMDDPKIYYDDANEYFDASRHKGAR